MFEHRIPLMHTKQLLAQFSLFRYHIDTNQLNFPKKEMEVSNYMKDGMITDWDMFEQVLLHCLYVKWLYHRIHMLRRYRQYYHTVFKNPKCNGRCWITLTRRSSNQSQNCIQFCSQKLPGTRKTGGSR